MQISEKYRNKKIAVLGAYGIEGEATQKYLLAHNLRFDVLDKKDDPDYLEKVGNYEVVFRTPGISMLLPQLVDAESSGTVFTSQVEEFFDLCPCKIIGVTGTKGKGTTSTLIHDILLAAGKDVYLGGNIGNPSFSFLDELTASSLVVLELSSFQLQPLERSPEVAVLLNVTSEHLDYHKNTQEYREAKANIVKYQGKDDFAIVNADYPVPAELTELIKSRKLFFSRHKRVDGCYISEEDMIVLEHQGQKETLASVSEMKLRGRHNLENITAASLAASVVGVPAEVISKVVKNFCGLEHRLELVREVNSVHYYDDSFSTVPETAIAALDSFLEPIILIAGGSSKNSDYTELGKKIADSRLRTLILIGETAAEIKEAIGSVDFPIVEGLTNMEQIVASAREAAKAGDVVLLSPACASRDMFANYKDRGDQFKAAVKKL